MEARDFAVHHGVINRGPGAGFYFGLKDPADFADALIELAEQIRKGELCPQKISMTETATSDDYCIQVITIEVSPNKINSE
jgi:hypothetical protein